jgi:hypothetical protein
MGRSFAASVGAFVGAISTLQFGGGYIATALSMFVGGLVAWIVCDVRALAFGITRAFRESFTRLANWRPDRQRAHWAFSHGLSHVMRFYSVILTPIFLLAIWHMGFAATIHEIVTLQSGFTITFGFVSIFAAEVGVLVGHDTYKGEKKETRGRRAQVTARRGWRKFFYQGNPVVWSFWVAGCLLQGSIWALKFVTQVPSLALKATGALWRFLQLSFAYTHTDERRLCFLDAVIGGAVGIYYGNPAIGSAVGGVVGYLYAPFTQDVALRLQARFEVEKLRLAEAVLVER